MTVIEFIKKVANDGKKKILTLMLLLLNLQRNLNII